ncbi:MAG TPA: pantoate--beta-alanine ligase [Planctomycetota bacterium]|jgi:pantoate--beta-alanine ligase|nr:pantoate--beta-alanine ligase [Planctomycetota bacterium]
MRRVESIAEMRELARGWRAQKTRIGFVPTMGALHAGHLGLVRQAKRDGDVAVVSIFVNPLQFGPNEDFTRYPRDVDADARKLEEAGADVLFTTTPEEMYPRSFQTHVVPGALAEPLCGASRPGHFRGVTTVVAKLFHLVAPHQAYFGQKDFQQARVLQQMVDDLGFDLVLRILPTVREADGLALSSRNRYLAAEERAAAPALHGALQAVREAFDRGERATAKLAAVGREKLARSAAFRLDYLEVRDDVTLALPERLADGGVAAAAAFLGKTRLIDNVLLGDAARRLG